VFSKKKDPQSSLAGDSLVTDLGLKNLGGGCGENNPECVFWNRLDQRLGVQHVLFRPGMDAVYQSHTHSEYSIFVCLSGALSLEQLGETCVARPGEALISNGGVEHSAQCRNRQSRCEFIGVSFDRDLLAALTEDFQLPRPQANSALAFTGNIANEILRRCALELRLELSQRDAGHKVVIENLAQRLLIETLRSWPRPHIVKVAANFPARLAQRDFFRAYEFMRRCRKESFRLQNLCNFLGISEERFTRLFLASTGNTPANFYNRLLLERARELLGDPALSIKEISFELGFKTTSHFIASFRREFSTTPQECRQHARVDLPNLALQVPTQRALVAVHA
jgi:AraC-like DNA-binding protein/mannose-6-phosphate isomerase-like protein (cupin superfamily)